MQRIYAIVIFLITATFTQAQINEVPILSNPILEKQHAEKEQQLQKMLQKRMAKMNLTVSTRDPFLANGACVESDSLHLICVDTTGLGFGSTVNILNNSSLSFGSATIDTNLCINYQSISGVDLGIDSLFIEVCSAGDTIICDTTIYPLYVHRADNETTIASSTIDAGDTITICVDSNTLPGDFSSASVLGNNTVLGDAFPFGDCIFYQSNLFAGNDTIVFEICDDFCNCDIYNIPITLQQDTLSLPFMDDFSYDGPYPNDKWLNQEVFVNNTMSIEPVSVGVATFDGLNESGAPHGGGYGAADDLTSAYLDLSPFNSNSNVWLSFYVQPQGLGEVPEDADSLILQYKTIGGDWNLIDTFKFETIEKDSFFILADTIVNTPGDTTFIKADTITSPKFSFFSYNINQNQYLYKGFQFRFRNFSKRSGNIDHWHVDYIRLRSNVNGSPFLEDIAFTEIPNSILKDYTSMPWWHFAGHVDDEIIAENEFAEVHIYNHQNAENTAEDGAIDLTELQTATNVLVGLGLFSGGEADFDPGRSPNNFPTIGPAAYPNFKNSMENDFPSNLKYLEFEKIYSFDVPEENPTFNPTVKDNNEVTLTTVFDNYFAYDDGTAEGGLEATTDDVQIAVKFHANVADTLKAVQIHFPHIFANTSNQIFNLKVWIGELDQDPEYVGILNKPLYIDSYQDSLNGFTTYILDNVITGERTPLAIPAGDFYVGWEQVSVCNLNQCIAVGVDKNNPEGMQDVFFDAFGFGLEWKNVLTLNPTLTGSMMIRPVVGEGEPQQSSQTEEITNNTRFNIFPNPTNGFLNIEIENGNLDQFSYSIFDAVGKMISNRPLNNQLDISNLQSGIYFIKIVNNKTREIFNKKIILVK